MLSSATWRLSHTLDCAVRPPGIVVLANICSQSYDVWNETLKGSDFIGPENVEIRCES